MQGTDPHRFMQRLADELDGLQDRAEIEGLLDELEYVMAVLDPAPQDPAHDLAHKLRDRLDKAP